MKLLDYNLEKLKSKNEYLYDCINTILADQRIYDEISNKFFVIETKNGSKTIECLSGHNKIRLNSMYNPEREAQKWVINFNNISNYTSVAMFGIGKGVFYNALKEKLNLHADIFLYEPDVKLFIFCLANFDLSDILCNDKVFLYIDGINGDRFLEDMSERINWAMLSTQLECFHPAYDKLYKEKYFKFEYELEEFRNIMIARKNTSLLYAKKFTVNALKNLRFIKESNYISELKGKIDKDVPVIIVSAGPSLDKNINILRKAEGKAFILTVDTAVKYLLANDIKFDAIVTVDGRKSLKHFNDDRCSRYPLFTVPDAKSDVLEKNHSRKIWINGTGYLQVLYEKYNMKFPKYISGGSVATAAFWIAEILEVEKIILVGQDLSYDGEMTHAGKIKQNVGWKDSQEIYVEGINGDKVKTRADWLNFIKWFENAVERVKGKTDVIDATEGGAKIAGTLIMPLRDAIERYCNKEFKFSKILKELPVTFDERVYTKLCNDIYSIKNGLVEISKAAKKGSMSAIDNIDMLKNKKYLSDKLNRNQEIMVQSQKQIQNQDIYILLDEYISADIEERLSTVGEHYDNVRDELLEKSMNSKVLFAALEKAANELLPVLEDTIKHL